MMGTDNTTFQKATTFCQQLGGFLYEPRSRYISMVARLKRPPVSRLFIGLKDISVSGQRDFRWQTNNAALTWHMWDKNNSQPDNRLERCVIMKSIHANKWHDVSCESSARYLCQANISE